MRTSLVPAWVFLAVSIALPAYAGGPAFSSLHPEEQYSNNIPPLASPEAPYQVLIETVQRQLLASGFDAGPVNGDFGVKTQAALAQFQIANVLPASGQLDDATLKELGIARPQNGNAAAGATSDRDRSTSGN